MCGGRSCAWYEIARPLQGSLTSEAAWSVFSIRAAECVFRVKAAFFLKQAHRQVAMPTE